MKILLSQLDLPENDLRGSVDQDELWELADSMRIDGQLQPIGVRNKDGDRYEVTFGSRRTQAARLLEWTEIEAALTELADDRTTAARKLVENVQRKQLTPMEEAYGLAELIGDAAADVRALQARTGKSREWIKSRLALLNLPDDMQAAVQAGVISMGVAHELAAIPNTEVREQYVNHAVNNGCSTDTARVWAAQARFADAGAVNIPIDADDAERMREMPSFVSQRMSCFGCTETYDPGQINMLIFCRRCQETIRNRRTNGHTAGR